LRLINRDIRTCCAFLLASLLVFPALSTSAPAASRRARARAAYESAVRLWTTLASRPQNARQKSDYEKVIRTFRAVHQADPAYGKAPVALKSVAILYAEMGERFASDEYYRSAIEAYQNLISQYPQSGLSRDALLAIGGIYRSELENPEQARQTFQEYAEKYPRSAKTAEAQEKVRQIDRLLAERESARLAKAEKRRAGTLPEVTAVRRWVGPSYSRIVISVEGEVKFESNRLPNPDRIVLDLANARLSSALVRKTFPVEDGFLRQIRIGQYLPTVTRVVLDVERIEDYSVFTLPNPFRLVIDINGPPSRVAEKPAEAKPTKAPPAPASEETLRAAAKKPSPVPTGRTAATAEPSETKPDGKPAKAAAGVVGEAGGAKPTGASEPKETASAKLPSLPSSAARQAEPGVTAPAESVVAIKPSTPTDSGARTLTRALGLKIARIVIDPGHGGHDTGTIGPTGLCEKDLVLDVAIRLKKLLEAKTGAEVILTRADDTFIPLEERTAIANEKAADLFISIHANGSRDRRARGIESYYLNFTSDPEALEVAARENATTQESVHQLQDLIKKIALTEKIEESQDFATQIQREVYSRLRRFSGEQKNRGVKKAPFVVLIGANMPSVLAEISFLTNPQDERLLKRPEHRQRIAEALYRGVARYVSSLGGVKVAQEAQLSGSPGATSPKGSSPAAAPHF
jgi:N-acetylmuramoyl-L-alanine amidase